MDYYGTDGDDTIDTRILTAGKTYIAAYGKLGTDMIYIDYGNPIGGEGNDTIISTSNFGASAYWGSPSSVYVDLFVGYADDGWGGRDTLINVKNVHGSNHDDTIIGSSRNDFFYGGNGNDIIDGGAGLDVVQFLFEPSTSFLMTQSETADGIIIKNISDAGYNNGAKNLRNVEKIEFIGSGSDNFSIITSSFYPSSFTVRRGEKITNLDAQANPRWALGNFNGDDYIDIAIRFDPNSAFGQSAPTPSPVRFFLGGSDGEFKLDNAFGELLPSPILVAAIESGDLNNDGIDDIIVAASGHDPYLDGKAVGPWPGEVSYIFQSAKYNSFESVAPDNLPQTFAHSLNIADIDNDGDLDAFVGSLSGAISYFLINSGDGGMSLSRSNLPDFILNHKVTPLGVAEIENGEVFSKNTFTSSGLFDANNDGFVDLLLLPAGETDVGRIFINDKTGNFSDDFLIRLPAGSYGEGYFYNDGSGGEIARGTIFLDNVTVDVNGDGLLDIIALSTKDDRGTNKFEYYSGAAVQIFINSGYEFIDQTSSRIKFLHAPGSNYSHYHKIFYSDINSDGFRDIILYRSQGNLDGGLATKILVNSGVGTFSEAAYPAGIPEGLLIPIDSVGGNYALVESGTIRQPAPDTYGEYYFVVNSVKYDWSTGRDFFSGFIGERDLSSDLPGRWVHGSNNNDVINLESGNERAFGYGGNDEITGGSGSDTIDGGAGDDTIREGVGDDYYMGGLGFDVISYEAASEKFAVIFDGDLVIFGDDLLYGKDVLDGVELINFSDQIVDAGSFYVVGNLSDNDRKSLTELYIASFNRAPDAIGLNYWASRLYDGMTLPEIARSFFVQPETVAAYPDGQPTAEFVTRVYNNVLSRAPDNAGLQYWVNELETGSVTKDVFLLAIINGAKAATGSAEDRRTLENKTDVGEYYAFEFGLNNVTWALDVMSSVSSNISTVVDAYEKVESYGSALSSRFNFDGNMSAKNYSEIYGDVVL